MELTSNTIIIKRQYYADILNDDNIMMIFTKTSPKNHLESQAKL